MSQPFDTFVLWVYHHLPERDDLQAEDGVNAYLLADRFCMEEYKNDIVNGIRSRYATCHLPIGPVQYLVENGPQDCQLLKYFIQQLAFNIVKHGSKAYLGEDGTDVHLAQAGANLLGLLFPELDRAHKADKNMTLQDPARLSGCQFHDHIDTWSCGSN